MNINWQMGVDWCGLGIFISFNDGNLICWGQFVWMILLEVLAVPNR